MKGKPIRNKGKIKLSNYFKNFHEGENVAIVKELSVMICFPKRIVGKTGKIVGSRGTFKLVQINDGNKMKTFIIPPIHLKKLNQIK